MNIFFGAGKIGKRYLELWQKIGLQVDYFIDNNRQAVGKRISGVEVISPERLSEGHSEEYHIYITCADTENIFRQLDGMGIPRTHVESISLTATLELFKKLDGGSSVRPKSGSAPMDKKESDKLRVLFDLHNGMVLGGVESWSVQSAHKLEPMGIETGFLVGDNGGDSDDLGISKEKIYRVNQKNSGGNWDWLEHCVVEIGRCKGVVVCNFVGYPLMAACFAKIFFPNTVRIIAVVHSDVETYYDFYMKLEGYIDKCLVISEKIRNKLMEKGFPMEKCLYLPWEIPCHETLNHVSSPKSDMLRLGYAGRVVKWQKRADCLAGIAEKLKNRGIPFILEIAGKGTYQNELEEEIAKKGLSEMVRCPGMLKRQDMDLFWRHQDIMVSCSECEGHSISQAEAMASGAVPVITDVSGAADDVTDGYNGYIVPIGDIDTLVERICYLHFHREELEKMRVRAYSTIYEKQKELDLTAFWSDLLEEVWRS